MPGAIISKRFQEILAELGWTKEYCAEKSGLPYETVKNLYYGKTPDPKVSTLDAIASATGHSMNCFIGKCPHTTQEKILIRQHRLCSIHGKNRIEMIARYESSTGDVRDSLGRRRIPCSVPPQVDVRKGIMYDSCDTIYIWTSDEEAELAIEMVGNELSPLYCKGDQLLFANRFPANGEHAAFLKDGRVYIRKYIEEDGQYILKCLHNEGKDIVVKRMDQIQYLGTCVGVIRK